MFDLSGRKALVTGATGGIGGAIARALHAQGATVAISGTRRAALDELAASLGERVHVVRAPQVWQGHFTGGRNLAPGAQPTALDWADVTARFASLPDCARWMHDLKRQYSTYQGWKGCLRIR